MYHLKRNALFFCAATVLACSGAEDPNNGNNGNVATNGATNSGNAGTNNAVDYSGLVINEIAASGDPNDWFELYNSGDSEIDLTDVTFTDDPVDPAKGAFDDGTTLAADSYMMVEVTDEGAGFKLGGDEALAIYAPDGDELDGVDWDEGDSPDGKSFGRIPNGTGDFKTLNTPTPGAENVDNDPDAPECGDDVVEGEEVCDGLDFAGATCESEGFADGDLACSADCMELNTSGCEAAMGDVVINEVTADGDDNIELFNAGDASVSLDGWWVTDDGYLPDEDPEHRYDFPAGTEIAAGDYLVLVKETDHAFGVGGDDTIILYDASDTVVDQTTWPDGDADVSWCRIPDGTGEFQACTMATFDDENMSE